MKTKRIDLKPFIRQVARQKKRDEAFNKAHEQLPQNLREHGRNLIRGLAKQFSGDTIDVAVVEAWLYSHGYDQDDTRTLLWSCVDECIIKFDHNFNIKCP